MSPDLSHHHRRTLEKIFRHPAGGNIEWREVLSLLEQAATTTEEHNGKVKAVLGSETLILHPPRGKDIDVQMVVDLRRFLADGGLRPER